MISDKTLRGAIPAMATPFTASEELDLPRLRTLLADYLTCGVHGISTAGSQGEFFALDHDEHIRLLETTVEVVAGEVPIYAGTGAVTTRESIRLTKAAEAMGVDVALLITPYFAQPSQDELVEHFVAVARATKLPVLLYNNPPRTAVNILPETLERCMKAAPNVIGVKDSSGDVTQSIEYVLKTGGLLYSGRDTIALSLLQHGASGAISPAANVFPRLMVRLYESFSAGDAAEALRISNLLAPLRAAWALGSFPVVIKEAMAIAGRDAGPTRRPIMGLASEKKAILEKVVAAIQPDEVKLA